MKFIKFEPIIEQVCVIIEGVKYRDRIHTIEVTCDLDGYATQACCEEPSYFMMGSNFWDENFGKRQANRIRKICAEQVTAFKEKKELE